MTDTCPWCGQRLQRLRSTGRGSQSAHLHGHLRQIAEHCGYTLGEMKEVMKADCPAWRHRDVVIGGRHVMVPESEADASVEEESAAIEWCHYVAAELGVVLREE